MKTIFAILLEMSFSVISDPLLRKHRTRMYVIRQELDCVVDTAGSDPRQYIRLTKEDLAVIAKSILTASTMPSLGS